MILTHMSVDKLLISLYDSFLSVIVSISLMYLKTNELK